LKNMNEGGGSDVRVPVSRWPKQCRVKMCFCSQIFSCADNFTEKDSNLT